MGFFKILYFIQYTLYSILVGGFLNCDKDVIILRMALTNQQIKQLADLARIEVTEAEIEKLHSDFEGILAYVDQIESVNVEDITPTYFVKNVLREDIDPHTSGLYTKDILDSAPSTKDGFIKVKKIL